MGRGQRNVVLAQCFQELQRNGKDPRRDRLARHLRGTGCDRASGELRWDSRPRSAAPSRRCRHCHRDGAFGLGEWG